MPNENPSRFPDCDDAASPGILLADSQGRSIHVNSRWCEMTGSTAEQNSAEPWVEFVHPDDREIVRTAWEACVQAPRDLCLRLRLGTPGGHARALKLQAAPMPAAPGSAVAFALTLEDAAGVDKSEDELLHSRKMEAVGRLASGLAHDFANLLTLISGYGEILIGRMAAGDPLRPEVDEIRKAANRGAGLTRQLLAFSRRQMVAQQLFDLNCLIADMQRMLPRMIGEHIDLVTHLGADLGSVKADPGQMEQVIMNLAINARDAMPRGGKIVIRTANVDLASDHERVKLGLEPGPYVMLQFTDTGYGMDAGTLQRLFEPFFTTKDKGQGTGLGLATVYGIVKQSRGDVWAESQPGKGTSFTIYLPRVAGTSQPLPQDAVAGTSGHGTETILLVEDEDGVRRLLKHILSKQGYTVLEAASGPEALTIHQQLRRPVDLLLTDIVMPRMSGRELVERLEKLQPGLKVIFMSGYTDEVLLGAGTLQPGALFLQKPLRPDVLAARVREVLDGSVVPMEPERARVVPFGI